MSGNEAQRPRWMLAGNHYKLKLLVGRRGTWLLESRHLNGTACYVAVTHFFDLSNYICTTSINIKTVCFAYTVRLCLMWLSQ